MSYAEMRKALENSKRIIKGDFQDAPDESEVEQAVLEQIDNVLKSEITTAELVSELRKRDGVATFEIDEMGSFEIQTWTSMDKLNDYDSGQGKAIILRITD